MQTSFHIYFQTSLKRKLPCDNKPPPKIPLKKTKRPRAHRNFTGSPTVLIFFDCVLNKMISLLFQFQRVIRLLENVDTEMQVTRTVTMRWKCSMTYIPCFSYRTKYKKSTSCRRKRKSGLDLRWVHQFLFAHLVKLWAVLFTSVRRARSDRKNSRAKTGDETLVSRVSRPQCLRGYCFCRFFLAFSLSLI